MYIFGGGFNIGTANDAYYGPDFLLSLDNILVTIHYRLGIFGFLQLNDTEYTGNAGLKDQQLALKWIHQNIEHFSGNKDQITIFGQSAGEFDLSIDCKRTEFHGFGEKKTNFRFCIRSIAYDQ